MRTRPVRLRALSTMRNLFLSVAKVAQETAPPPSVSEKKFTSFITKHHKKKIKIEKNHIPTPSNILRAYLRFRFARVRICWRERRRSCRSNADFACLVNCTLFNCFLASIDVVSRHTRSSEIDRAAHRRRLNGTE